jgi:hypothetical protein
VFLSYAVLCVIYSLRREVIVFLRSVLSLAFVFLVCFAAFTCAVPFILAGPVLDSVDTPVNVFLSPAKYMACGIVAEGHISRHHKDIEFHEKADQRGLWIQDWVVDASSTNICT